MSGARTGGPAVVAMRRGRRRTVGGCLVAQETPSRQVRGDALPWLHPARDRVGSRGAPEARHGGKRWGTAACAAAWRRRLRTISPRDSSPAKTGTSAQHACWAGAEGRRCRATVPAPWRIAISPHAGFASALQNEKQPKTTPVHAPMSTTTFAARAERLDVEARVRTSCVKAVVSTNTLQQIASSGPSGSGVAERLGAHPCAEKGCHASV